MKTKDFTIFMREQIFIRIGIVTICTCFIVTTALNGYTEITLRNMDEFPRDQTAVATDTKMIAKAYRETLGNLRLTEASYTIKLGLTKNQYEFMLVQFRRESSKLDQELLQKHFISDGDRLDYIAFFWRNNKELINSLTDSQRDKHFKSIKGIE